MANALAEQCAGKKISVTRRHGAGGGSARVRVVVAGSRASAYRPGRSISPLRTLTNRAARGFILIKFSYLFVRVCSFPSPQPFARRRPVAFHAILFAFRRTSSSSSYKSSRAGHDFSFPPTLPPPHIQREPTIPSDPPRTYRRVRAHTLLYFTIYSIQIHRKYKCTTPVMLLV